MDNSNNSNKTKWIHIRLSPAEYKIIKKHREKSTCRSLSHYLRNVLLDRPLVTTYRNLSQDDMIKQIAVLNEELNAIGNNLNQVTKRLHTLRPSESVSWGAQFSIQAETILSQIAQVKEAVRKIAERWLR